MIRETTSPCGEICQSELPLRAHKEPKPATRLDGFGTSMAAGWGEGVPVALGETDDAGGALVAGDVTLVVPAVEQAVSRTTTEQR